MFECTQIHRFTKALFSRDDWAHKAARILVAIWQARSVRMTHVAYELPGNPAGNYKFLQRFISEVDVKASLNRLFDAEADYVLGDITEMPRPRAYKTDYVGRLSDGAVRGYCLLMLATPQRGRAMPC